MQNMYRKQSLITSDQFYEMKPLTKLEAVLSFIDYSLFEEVFQFDSQKRGPKGYSKKQLFILLLANIFKSKGKTAIIY